MPDHAQRLIEEARLDEPAAAVVRGLTPEAGEALVRRWDEAVRSQDRQLRDAVDGALSMLPRPLRRQVLRLFGGMLW